MAKDYSDQINQLGIEDETIKKHLNILLNAIKAVKEEHIWFYINKDEKSYCIEQVERTFTYELYRQWKNALDNDEFTINSEIQKVISDDIKNYLYKNTNRSDYKYPDYVLHKSQEDFKQKNQLLICEVKRSKEGDTDNKGIVKDFRLFLDMMNREVFGYPYAYSVFIVLGEEDILFDIAKKILSDHDSKISLEKLNTVIDHERVKGQPIKNRILCISYWPKGENRMPTINTLRNYIER